ncbi:MAG: tetratricopeptide repeat protein [Lewinellaceae bacterium]|nr:tetratricopeptide repeat protein [Lewinella sp.]MCB9279114.1 tetratricopeptide repeat protein [Lewinellaceae bacterium]
MDRLNRLKEMLGDSPEDPFLLFAMSKEYESIGEHEEALKGYHSLKNLHPDYTGLYYHLGKLLEQLKRPEEARMTYEEGIRACKRVGDHHALRELSGAVANLEMDLDD